MPKCGLMAKCGGGIKAGKCE